MIRIDYDISLDDWLLWAVSNCVPLVQAFVRFRPDCLNDWVEGCKLGIGTFCTPRTLFFLSECEKCGVCDDPEIIRGCIGDRWGVEYSSFRKVFKSLPDIREIHKNPKTAPVPDAKTDAAALYATCGALVAATKTMKECSAVFVYASRMSAEYAMMLVKSLAAAVPNALLVPEYGMWFAAHKDMVL
jgi:hypothetical protein